MNPKTCFPFIRHLSAFILYTGVTVTLWVLSPTRTS
jgi:hypothetical protein